jgi:hypothetical protein
MEQQAHDISRLAELESAAALGSAEAQYEIACMVLEGRGVPRDVKFATAWFGYVRSFCMLRMTTLVTVSSCCGFCTLLGTG